MIKKKVKHDLREKERREKRSRNFMNRILNKQNSIKVQEEKVEME